MPRLMAMPAGEVREVFCGSYTTFAITSGFISFFAVIPLGGDLLSFGKGKDGRLGRAVADEKATVRNRLHCLFF